MGRRARIVLAIIGALAILTGGGFFAYMAVEGSAQFASAPATGDCRTPEVQYGWAYEAINYEKLDDAQLAVRNANLADCTYQGTKAGSEIVTDDGIRIAGWYIPAANGAGPTAPTVIAIHGFQANKSGILHYTLGLHPTFNLVVFDMRNTGRSTGTATTGGILEQKDLRAVIDWLERTKRPTQIGVLGNSLGAAVAISEAATDPRVKALALDSMHTRLVYQVEARIAENSYPVIPTVFAVQLGMQLRTGVDIFSADAEDALPKLGRRPILLTHGTADAQDLPARTQALYERALSLGIPAELDWCPGSGHTVKAGMPAEVCASDFATWTRDFFARTLA